jgi:hypothetical protein
MLLSLLKRELDPLTKASITAEGIQIYSKGLKSVRQERFNMLLDDRFKRVFDPHGQQKQDLHRRIEEAVESGKSSSFGASYLAGSLFLEGHTDRAIHILHKQREKTRTGLITWVKEAELYAKAGRYDEAARTIDTARRNAQFAENDEVLWSLYYWDLIISFAVGNFQNTRNASAKLNDSAFGSRESYPQGYYWQQTARSIPPQKRNFKEHAKIWNGRIDNLREEGKYGRIAITNLIGETYFIGFNPKYFLRKVRHGEYIQFVVTILSSKLRADDVNSSPFVNTNDDIFVT